jgi:hypothetical protein
MVGIVLGTMWYVVTLPFRLVLGVVALFGRLAALVLGFVFMVLGVALSAGPTLIVGAPLFVVGLVITIKSLD